MEQKRESDNRVLRMGVKEKGQKNRDTFNLLCIVPIFPDDLRRGTQQQC